jgi:dihydrofolate reductase
MLDISTSLDGYISQPDDSAGPIHDWFFAGETTSRYNPAFKTSAESRPILDEMFESTGALVVGRRTYDFTGGWDGNHPMPGVPVVVVTHRPPSHVPEGTTPFTFAIDGVEDAIDRARALADGRNVVVMGGARLARQCLMAGLLEEMQIHLAPVLLGEGVHLFDRFDGHDVKLEVTRVVPAPDATHLRYRVLQ